MAFNFKFPELIPVDNIITGTRTQSGEWYNSFSPIRLFGKVFAATTIAASALFTATITFTALTPLLVSATSFFSLTGPWWLVAAYAVSVISSIALATKAGYETKKFLWQKAINWGQTIDDWIFNLITGKKHFLEAVKWNIETCEKDILPGVEDSINEIAIFIAEIDNYQDSPEFDQKALINKLKIYHHLLLRTFRPKDEATIADRLNNAAKFINDAKEQLRKHNFYIPHKDLEYNPSKKVDELGRKITSFVTTMSGLRNNINNKLTQLQSGKNTTPASPTQVYSAPEWLKDLSQQIITMEAQMNELNKLIGVPVLSYNNKLKQSYGNFQICLRQYENTVYTLKDNYSVASRTELEHIDQALKDLKQSLNTYDSHIEDHIKANGHPEYPRIKNILTGVQQALTLVQALLINITNSLPSVKATSRWNFFAKAKKAYGMLEQAESYQYRNSFSAG